MKILYVHGYNGSANGNTFQLLKHLAKLTADDIEVVSVDYNQYDCDEAHDQIMKKFREEHADILVGSSLGGFLVMTCTEVKHRVVFNPCLNPAYELPKLGMPVEYANSYKDWVKKATNTNETTVYGIFTKQDEVLGDKYKRKFEQIFNTASISIDGGHKMNENGACIIMQICNRIIRKYIK